MAAIAGDELIELSETHGEVRALAREFAAREIAPHSSDWNARHHKAPEAKQI